MRILSVIGARPQFIKAMPVSKVLRKRHEEVLVHTGQHYDYEMSAIFFEELKIPKPDYNLGIGSGLHGKQTGKMLIEIEKVLLKEKPDLVLVYGDTNSTLAGALACVKLHIPVGHIEAGMRSFDRRMPEEHNRIIVDHISDLLFVSTKTAVENLKKEGIKRGVYLVGDVMYDTLIYSKKIADKKSGILSELGLEPKEYLFTTVHRPSNTDDRENLNNIIDAFIEIDEKIIFSAHPRTLKSLKKYNLHEKIKNSKNVILIEPVSYLDSLRLIANADKVLTDSGGIQKEAYLLRVPCITLRSSTEWIETVEDGWNVLVGSDKNRIVKMAKEFRPKKRQRDLFGDGRASEKIMNIIDINFQRMFRPSTS